GLQVQQALSRAGPHSKRQRSGCGRSLPKRQLLHVHFASRHDASPAARLSFPERTAAPAGIAFVNWNRVASVMGNSRVRKITRRLSTPLSPLLALGGHGLLHRICPLLGRAEIGLNRASGGSRASQKCEEG